jgi:hypothetical protein
MNGCYMKMSTVVYSIKQQKKIMCFLLPVDSKPVADKMSVYKSKAIFEIEQCWICVVLWLPFWKWWPVEIFRCQESILDIIVYLHMKCRWNRTMSNLCGIVAAILKMATGRNFSMSGINLGHHYLPTSNLNFYCRLFMPCFGSHFENGRHLENFENVELLLRWCPIIVSKFMSLLLTI